MAQEKYHVFHIIVEEGSFARRALNRVVPAWKKLLGKRALCLKDYTKLSDVILAAIRVNEGEFPIDVVNSIQDSKTKDMVDHALFSNNE
jgi:hypothetical protein